MKKFIIPLLTVLLLSTISHAQLQYVYFFDTTAIKNLVNNANEITIESSSPNISEDLKAKIKSSLQVMITNAVDTHNNPAFEILLHNGRSFIQDTSTKKQYEFYSPDLQAHYNKFVVYNVTGCQIKILHKLFPNQYYGTIQPGGSIEIALPSSSASLENQLNMFFQVMLNDISNPCIAPRPNPVFKVNPNKTVLIVN